MMDNDHPSIDTMMVLSSPNVSCSGPPWMMASEEAISAEHRAQLATLISSLRTAEERTLLSQIESCLLLFELRELLQRIEAEQDRINLKPHNQPHSAMFARFLEWAYGKEEGEARNLQLQRLAHWFRWHRDTHFYRRLLVDTYQNQNQASASAIVRGATFSTRRGALTISYFYELAPRLPQLLESLDEQSAQDKLRGYLAVRPLTQLRKLLVADFKPPAAQLPSIPSLVTRSLVQVGTEADAEAATTGNAESTISSSLCALSSLAATAVAVSPSRATVAVAAVDSTTSEARSSSPATIDDVKHDDVLTPHQDIDSRSGSSGSSSDESQQHLPTPQRQQQRKRRQLHRDAATPPERSVVKRRSLKRKRATNADPSSSSPSPPPVSLPPPVIACLSASDCVPIELIRLGLSAWERQRKSEGAVSAQYRQAMDDALADLMWDLSDQLSDGDKLQLRDFQPARRTESRQAAAEHSRRMGGERQCATLRDILDKLAAAHARSIE